MDTTAGLTASAIAATVPSGRSELPPVACGRDTVLVGVSDDAACEPT